MQCPFAALGAPGPRHLRQMNERTFKSKKKNTTKLSVQDFYAMTDMSTKPSTRIKPRCPVPGCGWFSLGFSGGPCKGHFCFYLIRDPDTGQKRGCAEAACIYGGNCSKHNCDIAGCKRPKDFKANSNYCTHHRCEWPHCDGMKIENKWGCIAHSCNEENCKKALSKKGKCKLHRSDSILIGRQR